MQGFRSAPERTRTSTDHKVHKALNLARLPIPPQALGAASIAPGHRAEGKAAAASAQVGTLVGATGRPVPVPRIESVQRTRYSAEHTFD
jgi:hypothetical protein